MPGLVPLYGFVGAASDGRLTLAEQNQRGYVPMHPAQLHARDAIGYKAYTSNRSGIRFLVHVFSAASGALRVVMEADYLGMMRTGAASGVATRWLARPDARRAVRL